jgi:malonyl CoA-acyl carrier protein transacylase
MSKETEVDNLSPIKRALYEIRTLKGRVRELEQAQVEPVAIVGLGLRFPGNASNAASMWQILADGVDTGCEIPPSRWSIDQYFNADPDAPGKMDTRRGHFIAEPAAFDASFFGISPREATSLDPQHRIALEVAWEALENAGYSPDGAAANHAGVFLALSNSDYGRMVFKDFNEVDAYSSTGTILSVAAGRISYLLGLEGPSVVVDTACSGSLVSVHLACQSLRAKECRMALAGGVNLILSPEVHINFSKARMMAPDGRCKTFDSHADGFVRGEGCGILVLKRLSDATADGDNILAVIRGSAVNQDGHSGGLTVPNGKAQQAVIRQALAIAGVAGNEISYVEAHGTGTALGDPIEAHALVTVLGPGRTADNPLVLGSVKTNIGHLESAAGVAGMIKLVLSLQQETIPQHLHFRELNPRIDWGGVPVEIPVHARSWPRDKKRRIAGVSSFGFSGTNAHVIVEEAPSRTKQEAQLERPVHILTLSARGPQALQELVKRYDEELGNSQADLADICFTANSGRAHFDWRLAVVGSTASEIRQKIREARPQEVQERGGVRIAFLFSGQGAQYAGMGKELYDTHTTFRHTMDRCAEFLKSELAEPLLEVLWGRAIKLLEQTAYTQPALFALEYSLAELWKSWGIEPEVVLGHSVGEYVAACVAGVYGLEDGLRLIAARARLMQGVSGQGAMSAVVATEERVRRALQGMEERVSLAAINAPESVVISGYEREVAMVEEQLEADGLWVQRLAVSHGFHSPQMDEMTEKFEHVARSISYQPPRVRMVSSVTGELVAPQELNDPRYWRRQVRQPVHYARAIESLIGLGNCVFLEIGPGTTLTGLGKQSVAADNSNSDDYLWAVSLRKNAGDWGQILDSLARLYTRGGEINWKGFDKPYRRRRVALPTYPFQRQRYWIENKTEIPTLRINDRARWGQIRESASHQSQQCRMDLDITKYPERWALLDRLTSAYIVSVLQQSGLFQIAGEQHSLDSVMKHCAFIASFERLVRHWLDKLVAENLLRQIGEKFIALQPLQSDLQTLRSEAEVAFAGDRIFLDYVNACGADLIPILRGKMSSLETLFPGGEFTRAEDLYERAPLSAYFGSIARAALEAFVRGRRTGGLRIVEVGAGTGSTTSALLPVLPPDTIYCFTDLSDLFLTRAADKFAAFPFVRFGHFDIERDGTEQGYPVGGFDVVVATNVLHATKDIRVTIANVRSLLAPGGILILCEVTSHLPWFDITTGLIEGWQLFDDGLRGDHPLLSAETWASCLQSEGFDCVMTFPENGSPANILGQHVLVAGILSAGAGRHVDLPFTRATELASTRLSTTASREEIVPWLAVPAADRHEFLVGLVRSQVAEMMRFDSRDRVEGKHRLVDLGLDSLMALELRNRLVKALGLNQPLSSTLVYDYPTPDDIASHLEQDVLGLGETAKTERAEERITASRVAELEALNEEDVESLLLKKLQTL